jgi:Alpha amylase, catalytic domain.
MVTRGTMNYAAFTRPLWQWLVPPQPRPYAHGKYPALPNLPGRNVVAAMRALSGVTPWQATLHAMNLIGSHDTHRVASLLGDPRLVDVAFGLLASYPGVPMIYQGDELGLEAWGPEYARLPMPWDHPERWDQHRLGHTRELFTLRAGSSALRRGGLRWLSVEDDALTFVRESPDQAILVHAARAGHVPVRLPAAVVGSGTAGARRRRGPPRGRGRRRHPSSRRPGLRDVAHPLAPAPGARRGDSPVSEGWFAGGTDVDSVRRRRPRGGRRWSG